MIIICLTTFTSTEKSDGTKCWNPAFSRTKKESIARLLSVIFCVITPRKRDECKTCWDISVSNTNKKQDRWGFLRTNLSNVTEINRRTWPKNSSMRMWDRLELKCKKGNLRCKTLNFSLVWAIYYFSRSVELDIQTKNSNVVLSDSVSANNNSSQRSRKSSHKSK